MKESNKILEKKRKTLLLIGLAYIIPIFIFFFMYFLSTFGRLPSFLKIFISLLSPFFLLLPGFLILGLFYLFNLPIPESFTSGEAAAFFSPTTFIGSYIFWTALILIVYLLIRNKSNIKKKIGLFIISFITIFSSFVSLKLFQTYMAANYSLFFLIFSLSIITLSIFIAYKLYKRLVYENEK